MEGPYPIVKGKSMTKQVKLISADQEYSFPLLQGKQGEPAIDISQLRDQTGLITLDYSLGRWP